MEANYLEERVRKSWFYRYKFPLLISFIVFTVIVISFSLSYQSQKDKTISNPDFIYNTWKVEKLYKNGKLVINSSKYRNLYFQVNRDGKAIWIKDDQTLELNFVISPDGSQMIFDDGMRVEDVETIFELKTNILRFGKRTINSHYEYVLTAVPTKGGNFF